MTKSRGFCIALTNGMRFVLGGVTKQLAVIDWHGRHGDIPGSVRLEMIKFIAHLRFSVTVEYETVP